MSTEQKVALDIYTYIYRIFLGTTEEEINFRINKGERGCIQNVLNYIGSKYLKGN